ncbi:hypothetical protein GNI_061900 [Gregarina niphandrodes]|uniref:Uncharacterized protein n=1 Tax=Gregarina niphandrodes TaxID=110365 RepID=A0A023B8B4_GRENI|nr:hypothetical protein GNI_061900 [Gregarina niphandrodes]EZG68595.1 hypothetical protein GNI_061900 [Gregarina niphandrodes]|eukprot:XP_011134562.1 hypothetical protein GNI_061900 [Gregarina niphandrodes]
MLLRGKLLATLQERFRSSKLVPNWSEPWRVTEIKGHKIVAQSIWHKDLVYESPLSEVLKVTHSPIDLRTLTAREVNADHTQHIPLGTNPRHRANPYDQRPRAARSVRKTTEKPPRTPAGRGRTSPDADTGEDTNEARFHFALVPRA